MQNLYSRYRHNSSLINTLNDSLIYNHHKFDIYTNCLLVKTMCNILDLKDDCFYLDIIKYLKENFIISDYKETEENLSIEILNDNQSKELSSLLFNTFLKHLIQAFKDSSFEVVIDDYEKMIFFLNERYNLKEKQLIKH